MHNLNDIYLCIYCYSQFDGEEDYIIHTELCSNNPQNINKKSEKETKKKLPKKTHADNKKGLKSQVVKENLNKDEVLECELCSKVYALTELENYRKHILNGECFLPENSINDNGKKLKTKVSRSNNQKKRIPNLPQLRINNINSDASFRLFNDDIENIGVLHFFSHSRDYEGLNNFQLLEDPKKVLSKSEIERLNSYSYKRTENCEAESCNICLDELKNNELVIRLPCLHAFHSTEIIKWLNNSIVCPSCKTNVKTNLK